MFAIWITIIWLSAGEAKYATFARPLPPPTAAHACREEAAALQGELLKTFDLARTPYVRVVCAPARAAAVV